MYKLHLIELLMLNPIEVVKVGKALAIIFSKKKFQNSVFKSLKYSAIFKIFLVNFAAFSVFSGTRSSCNLTFLIRKHSRNASLRQSFCLWFQDHALFSRFISAR